MKKVLALVLVFVLLLSGCSVFDNIKDIAGGTDKKLSDEEMYSKLNSLIGYTNGLKNSDLTGEFTFVAMIFDEGEELYFEDDDYTGFYYSAGISRNWDDYFMLDTKGLDTNFKDGDIVKITGSTNGTVYWTEDNERVEVLDIKAKAVVPYTPAEIETSHDAKVTLKDGNIIEFVGAHTTKDSFNEVVAVYFNFTNKGSKEAAPSLRDFYIEYAEEEASSSSFSLDELDASALRISAGSPDKTYAGKTQLYCIAYTGDKEAARDEPIYFMLYDDEFRCTHEIALPISASLAEMKG